jgi:hypothetical protein
VEREGGRYHCEVGCGDGGDLSVDLMVMAGALFIV